MNTRICEMWMCDRIRAVEWEDSLAPLTNVKKSLFYQLKKKLTFWHFSRVARTIGQNHTRSISKRLTEKFRFEGKLSHLTHNFAGRASQYWKTYGNTYGIWLFTVYCGLDKMSLSDIKWKRKIRFRNEKGKKNLKRTQLHGENYGIFYKEKNILN